MIYRQIEQHSQAFERASEDCRVFFMRLIQDAAYALVDIFSFVRVGIGSWN